MTGPDRNSAPETAAMAVAPGTAPPAEAPWHLLDAGTVAARLGTSLEAGLDRAEAARRLARHGPNLLRAQPFRGPLSILLDQFADVMIGLLVAAAVVSGAIGEVVDTIAILAIVVLNAVVGFVQEYRAERALQALRTMAAPHATVVRDGHAASLPAAELVPGDVVLLEAGAIVPADLRLVEAPQLHIEEAALTGESVPVEKGTEALTEAGLPLGDRTNMAYAGTFVTRGRGRGVVVGTGMATELGRIADLLSTTEETRTPLQHRLARLGRQLSVIAVAACVVVFALGVLRGEPPVLMLLTAVSLAVAAVPEALPAVVTIGLALGAQRMVRRNALIRRLPAVETLGSVTVICSDKTGTLTENRMRAEAFLLDDEGRRHAAVPAAAGADARPEPWRSLLRAMALCNDADAEGADAVGDPTEVALALAAREAGLERPVLEARAPRIAELPFDPERKCMTTLHRLPDGDGGGVVAFTKGAPERVIGLCTARLTEAGPAPMDAARLLAEADRMAADGLRVLAFARRDWPALPDPVAPGTVERDLTFLGLVGLMDPPRPEAAQAVAECRSAGITPVMITGDHPLTARAIGVRVGILERDDAPVLTGLDMARLGPEALAQEVGRVRIYARVDPEQKIAIVEALQRQGEVVAMTGDGVNDAPALKRADIGVAMGRTGTDVSREASDMVLLDDNFASIVAAVREGRRIYDNIRKFVQFVLAGNLGEFLVLLVAPLLGLPIPLLPIHILWVNLVTDGMPGLALAVEPEEKGIMRRSPRPPGESIFARGLGVRILWIGVLIGALSLGTQAFALANGSHWQTMVFTTLVFCQLFQAMAIRTERESVFAAGIGSNRAMLGAVLAGAALQLAVVYVPFLNGVMRTQPLTAFELAFCIAVPSQVFFAIEIEKWLVRRGVLRYGAPAPAR